MVRKTIRLEKPIKTLNNTTLYEITLRPPTRGDLRNALKHSNHLLLNEFFLLSQLTNLSTHIIVQLSLRDREYSMQALAELLKWEK